MDLNCSQIITSGDYYDYIAAYTPYLYNMLSYTPGVCVNNIDNQWLVIHYEVDGSIGVSTSGYIEIPKLFTLTDTSSIDASGITQVHNQPVLNLLGRGVLIGFIDTGIDYLNPIFQYARGLSKIDAIWDQTIQSPDSNPSDNPYKYGTIYTNSQINDAIAASLAGDDPYAIVPSKDDNGHGTFIAGIAAGGADKSAGFTGAAPDASIAMVKLKPAKQYLRDFFLINDEAVAFQENDIMTGMQFLKDTANAKGKPLVICIGLGSSSGPHNGGTPLAAYANDLARQSGIGVVCSMGNEGNARHHFSGIKPAFEDYATVELSVSDNEKGFVLELWADRPEMFSISIVSPTGELIPRIPARRTEQSSVIDFVFEQTRLYIDYQNVESLSGNQLIFMRFINPTGGIWKINVHGLSGLSGEFDMWLPVTAFLTGDVHFVRPSPDTTLTQPATAFSVISAGAYDHLTGGIYIANGRGPTSDGRLKPDIVAPGVNVYGPSADGGYTYMTGTSVAAAHVAGAAALIFAWDIRSKPATYLSSTNLKTTLVRGARRAATRIYPNNEWGYGILDLYNSFEQMRLQ